jgi:putative thioredoxin
VRPCRQLTPALEKAVTAAKGAVKLVKIDVDKNPRFAGQLRVQSIPTVYAFVTASRWTASWAPCRQPAEDLHRPARGPAAPRRARGRTPGAAHDGRGVAGRRRRRRRGPGLRPGSPARSGQRQGHRGAGARLHRRRGRGARGRDPGHGARRRKDPELDAARAALKLASQAPAELGPYEARLQADPNDHEARLEFARALAGQNRLDEAVDQLLTLFAKDREWNEGAAKKQLLEIFEAAGHASDVAKTGRKRLSSLMFS